MYIENRFSAGLQNHHKLILVFYRAQTTSTQDNWTLLVSLNRLLRQIVITGRKIYRQGWQQTLLTLYYNKTKSLTNYKTTFEKICMALHFLLQNYTNQLIYLTMNVNWTLAESLLEWFYFYRCKLPTANSPCGKIWCNLWETPEYQNITLIRRTEKDGGCTFYHNSFRT